MAAEDGEFKRIVSQFEGDQTFIDRCKNVVASEAPSRQLPDEAFMRRLGVSAVCPGHIANMGDFEPPQAVKIHQNGNDQDGI